MKPATPEEQLQIVVCELDKLIAAVLNSPHCCAGRDGEHPVAVAQAAYSAVHSGCGLDLKVSKP